MGKKIVGNLVGTTLPRIQVDEVLDANSNNAIANKVVAKIAQTQEQSLLYFGHAIDNHEERITALEDDFGNINVALENIIAIQNSLIGGGSV